MYGYVAMDLRMYVVDVSLLFLQTMDCDNYTLNLTYCSSQNITHTLLRQFYNGYVLHTRFINEILLVKTDIRVSYKKQLKVIKKELEYNIAHIYYLVSLNLTCVANYIAKYYKPFIQFK